MYQFQYTLTNKEKQRQIMEIAKPGDNFFLVSGLEPAFGVEEAECQLFVVCRGQKERYDFYQTFYTTYFIVFLEDKVLEASYTAANEWYEGQLTYDVPEEQEKLIRQALDFWRNWAGRLQYEKELMLQGINLKRLGDELRFARFLDWKASLEAPDSGYLSFLEREKSIMEAEMERTANQAWAAQECRNVLEEMAAGSWEKFERKLVIVSHKCKYEISRSGDDASDAYTKACRVMFEAGINVPVDPVSDYLKQFERKFNPVHVKELLEAIEAYQKPDISWEEEPFRMLVAKLRHNIAEILAEESYLG